VNAAPRRPPLLVASGMVKRFGSMLALDDVSLTLRPGTFHALLGENGAGKSTLVQCIMGYRLADQGTLEVDGQAKVVRSPRDAQALGIGMVYQHFTVVPNMTVAENFVMARARLPLLLDWSAEHDALREFMRATPFQIDPARTVGTLAAGERQKLEILKQLYLGNRVLILDEPTSVLTPEEADQVLGTLRAMTRAGDLSVLMISHKLREVVAFADEVTVLRRGRVTGRGQASQMTAESMASRMVGAEPPRGAASRGATDPGATRLALERLRAVDDRGRLALDGVSLTVRAGEIVGIAGVSGNGQEELVQVLAGQRSLVSGRVLADGEPYGASRGEARARGLRCLPEEPLRNACVPTMTVAENVGLRVYDTPPFTRARWLLRRRALRAHADSCIATYRIKARSVDAPMESLSGGNVQRAVLARELDWGARILVVANPCFGLDFAAVSEIRGRLFDARNAGVALLLLSADLDEIFALSDRILVMSQGRIVHETGAASAEIAVIGRHMAGHGRAPTSA
jgi:ABC-type uncharacterized transport system ATPase subunit